MHVYNVFAAHNEELSIVSPADNLFIVTTLLTSIMSVMLIGILFPIFYTASSFTHNHSIIIFNNILCTLNVNFWKETYSRKYFAPSRLFHLKRLTLDPSNPVPLSCWRSCTCPVQDQLLPGQHPLFVGSCQICIHFG